MAYFIVGPETLNLDRFRAHGTAMSATECLAELIGCTFLVVNACCQKLCHHLFPRERLQLANVPPSFSPVVEAVCPHALIDVVVMRRNLLLKL